LFISASADEDTGPQDDNLRFFFTLFCLTCAELTCPNSDGGVHARREHCIWQNMLCDGHQENRFLNLYLDDCTFFPYRLFRHFYNAPKNFHNKISKTLLYRKCGNTFINPSFYQM
jgi:hypothetical protein